VIKVRAVTKDDFGKVYPLFNRIPAPMTIPEETWGKLFSRQWDDQVEPLGFVLAKDHDIVGYIGLIAVKRDIRGQRSELVDISSWTVEKEYGGHAIRMLYAFLEDQSRTFISFTPSKSADRILRHFGFQQLNANLQIIPFWTMALGPSGHEVIFDIESQRSLLTKEDWKIYCDHRKFSSVHFMIKKGRSYCYVVAKRALKKKLPFLHVHYVSDKEIFARAIPKFTGMVCRRFKTWGLVVFEHYLEGQRVRGAIKMEMSSKPLFRSPNLQPGDIDSLYSEYFVLSF